MELLTNTSVQFFVNKLQDTYGAHDFQEPHHKLTNQAIQVFQSDFMIADGTSAHLCITYFMEKPVTAHAYVDKSFVHYTDPETGIVESEADCRMLADCYFKSKMVRYMYKDHVTSFT